MATLSTFEWVGESLLVHRIWEALRGETDFMRWKMQVTPPNKSRCLQRSKHQNFCLNIHFQMKGIFLFVLTTGLNDRLACIGIFCISSWLQRMEGFLLLFGTEEVYIKYTHEVIQALIPIPVMPQLVCSAKASWVFIRNCLGIWACPAIFPFWSEVAVHTTSYNQWKPWFLQMFIYFYIIFL